MYRRLTLFGDVFDKIRSDYVDKPDEAKLIEAAINGGTPRSRNPHAPRTPAEIAELKHNQHHTAARGREPGLSLLRNGQEVPLTAWGSELVDALDPARFALRAARRR